MNKETLDIIDNLIVENEEFEDLVLVMDVKDPFYVYQIPERCKEKGIDIDLGELEVAIQAHKSLQSSISKDDIKKAYLALKERDENPRGSFDKQGRFYVYDRELLNVREPSANYPYSQMNAARTAKFIKALAEKYKCQSYEELAEVAFS